MQKTALYIIFFTFSVYFFSFPIPLHIFIVCLLDLECLRINYWKLLGAISLSNFYLVIFHLLARKLYIKGKVLTIKSGKKVFSDFRETFLENANDWKWLENDWNKVRDIQILTSYNTSNIMLQFSPSTFLKIF